MEQTVFNKNHPDFETEANQSTIDLDSNGNTLSLVSATSGGSEASDNSPYSDLLSNEYYSFNATYNYIYANGTEAILTSAGLSTDQTEELFTDPNVKIIRIYGNQLTVSYRYEGSGCEIYEMLINSSPEGLTEIEAQSDNTVHKTVYATDVLFSS